MTLYAIIFYLLSIITLTATGMAVTRRNLVHAALWLVVSFFGTSLLFYLLGAPFLAALEVIIFAGAIMILFLFIIMTLRKEAEPIRFREVWRQWRLPSILGLVSLVLIGFFILSAAGSYHRLMPAMAAPIDFGRFLVTDYWLPVEIVSFLLFVALVGVLYLGRATDELEEEESLPSVEEKS